ncbi:TIGR02221 family CRISPR-associated protein [Saprospira grandis]|uniref:CRISPR-associated protein, TM1812 family n=1 Tax=Saprospira grandis (strain Lewin) TaxID=984262 RepID=H6L9K9_SAPGL|nr:TIGR02221 family CRISPR-associated protein [Saprospira grandis]AFC23187.1 CRISPR-associated protein, TM1812 family [Saprospira grandis str. Lewin]
MNQKKKVFISFLGYSAYRKVTYQFENTAVYGAEKQSSHYASRAILELNILKNWDPEIDEIYFFTTEMAKTHCFDKRVAKINYDDLTQNIYASENEEGGIGETLALLKEEGKIGHFEAVTIPDGFTESEMWEIFKAIEEKVDSNSELYMDVTNGYRFLPMLALSLINYLASVKDCIPKGLFYGNFEAGRGKSITPIQVLNNIIELGQWTDAVEMFTKASYPDELANLIKKENPKLASDVQKVADAILNCRGHQLTQEVDIDRIKNDINNLDGDEQISHQLRPILKKIDDKLSTLGNSTTLKGFHAVEWCIEHNMVQQGYTFLLETTISWLIEETEGTRYINREDYREIANGVLNKISANRLQLRSSRRNSNLSEDEVKEIARRMEGTIAPNRFHLTSNYKKMTGAGKRNDINHCGYKNNYATVGALKRDLKNISDAIINIVS